MKLCVLLFGLSYSENTENYHTHVNNKVDYRLSIDNYKKFIYDYFEELGYEIDTYLCTNFSNEEIQNQLLNDYSPKDYLFIEDKIDNKPEYLIKTINRNIKLQMVMELVKKSGNNYDLCLMTRFDLKFNIPLSDVNIMLDKMNIVSWWNNEKPLICDNFYLFPFKYLPKLILKFKSLPEYSYHYMYKHINKIVRINILVPIIKYNPELKFYDIVRNNYK